MITPYDDVHYMFLDRLVFELYDQETRDRIYDFYDRYNVKVYLPRHLDQRNWLEYIIEFKDMSVTTDRFKIVIEGDTHSSFRICGMKKK